MNEEIKKSPASAGLQLFSTAEAAVNVWRECVRIELTQEAPNSSYWFWRPEGTPVAHPSPSTIIVYQIVSKMSK